MSGARDPHVYLDDILDAAKKAREFSAGFSFEQFEADEKTVYAVVRALEIVGEASKQVAPEIRDLAPEIPWRLMTGMRDKLIHAYSGIDLKVVWRTIQEELPGVVAGIESLIRALDES
jgi:uncharacterized protein with HEPN domain